MAQLTFITVLALLLGPAVALWPPWIYHWPPATITSTVTVTSLPMTGRCHCPLQPFVTASPTAISHCPLETIVTTTAIAKCYCPLETTFTKTLTKTPFCNTTSPIPGTGTGTAPPTQDTISSSSMSSPPCSLPSLPTFFQLRTSPHTHYITIDIQTNRAILNSRSPNVATTFHVRNATDGSISGIEQLAFNASRANASDVVEYGAYIQTSGGGDQGAAVEWFETGGKVPTGYGIVTASFSTYLCELVLITWMEHDLSYAQDCGGELWLGFGLQDEGGCRSVKVLASAVDDSV